ncbi:MAG: DUF4870 domain-containing protein [Desulfobacterales bacterium]|jgi:uncharacterized membrane protein
MQRSSIGLPENIAGLLCYLLGWVSGLVFYLIEKRSDFVKYHATQSVIVFGTLTLASITLGVVPFIGALLAPLLSILTFALWIILMIKAYQHTTYKLPVAGDLAEKYARKNLI